jgi:hypothetical protein
VTIPTPGQEERASGIGAVNYHTGATVMSIRDHTWQADVAVLRQPFLDRPPPGTIYWAGETSPTHCGGEIEVVLKQAQGRRVLLDLPTYSPWLNPIERLWRRMRHGVTHCELFTSLDELKAAFLNYFALASKETVQRIIGSKAA